MDKKRNDTWMTVTSLVLGIIGLALILVSVFDSGAQRSVLTIGLLFIVAGNVLNVIRQHKKSREE